MSEPTFTAATETFYEGLPAYLRAADRQQAWLLKTICASMLDQVNDIQILTDRLDYDIPADGGEPGDTSDLVDPTAADDAWLDWLAQLVGVRLPSGLSHDARVDAVRYASAGWQGGTKTAVAAAAMSALTGSRYVGVYDHSTESGVGAGGEWDVLLVTADSETPDVDAVLAAVVAKGAKPAGVVLHHLTYSSSWDAIEAGFPTWDAIEAAGSWSAIEEISLP